MDHNWSLSPSGCAGDHLDVLDAGRVGVSWSVDGCPDRLSLEHPHCLDVVLGREGGRFSKTPQSLLLHIDHQLVFMTVQVLGPITCSKICFFWKLEAGSEWLSSLRLYRYIHSKHVASQWSVHTFV